MTPDYSASLAFLLRWAPEGPWILTSIEPDRKGIDTHTFRRDEQDALLAWLAENGSRRNVYFHVNPALRTLTKKAERADIAALAWLHVDIDPRAGEDLAAERVRALRLLTQPPGGLPPPTVVVFSGGGYQGFWRLERPVPIDGDLAKAEEAKRYNLQLELLFGADNCHNVDRIMRLPGTVNRPDAKKRAKGRTEELAHVVEWEDSRTYPIEKFTPAPQVQGAHDGFAGSSVKISGNVKRLSSVDELPPRVPDWCKVVIVQGRDPDDPDKYGSRSEALFAVCCELVRAEVSDDTIFSVLMDPDFGISGSVLDKGSGAERYAVRQIERARENAINPRLRELNERHAVISDLGGKCRVISEVWDPAMNRPRISRQSFEDFRNRYMSTMVVVGKDKDGKDIERPAGEWWLKHPQRRQYDTMVFLPGREAQGAYNLWKGFSCEARPGGCELFLRHLRENICSGHEGHYRYLLGWMARAIQHPDSPGYAAVVMRGRQGTGKSFFAKCFGSLWGRHFMQVADPGHLIGRFNAHLRDCVVLFGDEAFYANDRRHESILKMLVTEETLVVEAKGVDAEVARNCIHLIMASNESWVVPANVGDRRFFVLDVGDGHMRDDRYFARIAKELDAGGREALLHLLMTYDLSGFDVRDIPKTKALQEQKAHSLPPEQEWWLSKLMEGRILPEHSEWGEVTTYDLLADYVAYVGKFAINRRGNSTRLGLFLRSSCPPGFPRNDQRSTPVEARMMDGGTKLITRPRFYVFPDLPTCRRYWDDNFGGPYSWPEVLEESAAGAEVPF